MRELLESDTQSVDYRRELAKTESALAVAYRLGDRPDLALAAGERALATIEPVRAARPDDPSSRRVESEAARELGRALAELDQGPAARKVWQRALAASRPVAEESGGTSDLVALCFALLLLDELDEAQTVLDTLLRRGYRRSDLLALAREKGILSTERSTGGS